MEHVLQARDSDREMFYGEGVSVLYIGLFFYLDVAVGHEGGRGEGVFIREITYQFLFSVSVSILISIL